MGQNRMEKLLYGRSEAMAALGIGNTKLYELLTTGNLRGRKLGRKLLIEADSLREYARSLPAAKIHLSLRTRPTAAASPEPDCKRN
jgi:excisionase family DNA binding protein